MQLRARALVLLVFFCYSCAYRVNSAFKDMQVMLNIDGFREDTSLLFEQKLIEKLAVNNIKVGSSNFDMRVEEISVGIENIGYSFDSELDKSERLAMLYPDELRESLKCRFSIYDEKKKEYLIEPVLIEVFVDADFSNPTDLSELEFNLASNNSLISSLEFSLGQYSDRQNAIMSLKNPLYKKLVEEIMDLMELRVGHGGE